MLVPGDVPVDNCGGSTGIRLNGAATGVNSERAWRGEGTEAEGFGWIKTTGGLAKTRHRGRDRVGWMFTFTAAAYNLVRLPKLIAEAPT